MFKTTNSTVVLCRRWSYFLISKKKKIIKFLRYSADQYLSCRGEYPQSTRYIVEQSWTPREESGQIGESEESGEQQQPGVVHTEEADWDGTPGALSSCGAAWRLARVRWLPAHRPVVLL